MNRAQSKSDTLLKLTTSVLEQEANIKEGGGPKGRERQKKLGRMMARERIAALLDPGAQFFEIGLWSAWEMYTEWGEVPAAGVVCGVGPVHGRQVMVIANDASVKAGAFFPATVKKVLRAQRIAYECRLPLIYLVDSSGVFLPLQDEIFPDEDDFGRIFRNNAVISAAGIPQYAAVMGNCIAGGGYLPVLSDKLLMTEGSGLYLAGPALVKAAIGQVVDTEELGGAKMHAEISGTVDFHEPDDPSCLQRLRSLVALLPEEELSLRDESEPASDINKVYDIVGADSNKPYEMHDLISCIVDKDSLDEVKAGYGQSLVCAYARIGGRPVGIVANQRRQSQSATGQMQIGGVVYKESADKAARFVMDCNQTKVPLLFLQDVVGFMVGKEAEQSGIIRSGAKLVSAVSNSVVPKITVIVGNSFGAGNYALCGKAYDPNFIIAWPNAKYSVMGAGQAANTLFAVQKRAMEKHGEKMDDAALEAMRKSVTESYEAHMDIRYGAARGWVDSIIAPHTTRDVLINTLDLVARQTPPTDPFHTGVFQV